MYNPASSSADEFIDHQEVLDTLAYADKNNITQKTVSRLVVMWSEKPQAGPWGMCGDRKIGYPIPHGYQFLFPRRGRGGNRL
ncbi:MAG: hypothetical protein LBG24_05395 [Treponema sp.]|jgi:hypothetical protein|nr:hypothetical protein [Treponema sp.]